MAFWPIAGLMTLAALAFVLARLVFPRARSPHASPREANLAALRAAHAEIERDQAAGLLAGEQAVAAREELLRRAEEELDGPPPPGSGRPAWPTAAVASLAIPVAAFALYGAVGSPSAVEQAGDFARLAGPVTVERLPLLRDQLAARVAGEPKDARARVLLARAELALDRFPAAEAAFAEAVKDLTVARDPAVWCDYADAAGLAQGGRLEGRPAQFVGRALSLDAAYPKALEMAGSVAIERQDYAAAARHWRALLAVLAEDDPQRRPLAEAVEKVERLAAGSPRPRS